MRKKILVTGGAGYIGSHTVVELYKSGYLPIIVDNFSNTTIKNIEGINNILNTKISYYNIDCRNYKKLKNVFNENKNIFACIHFAAFKSIEESILNPNKYFENNIGSTEALLSCLDDEKFKNLIFSSSCVVYGSQNKLPVTEFSFLKKPESPYAETKQRCERLINVSKCNSITLRYFNPIGSHESSLIGDCSHDNPSNLLPIISETALGLRKELIINGNDYDTEDGTCVRDYIHVKDLASAHVCALNFLSKKNGKHVFNVGTGFGFSVMQMIKTFEKINRIKINYKIGPRRKGDIGEIYADCSLINKKLNWKAKRTIEQGVFSEFNWKRENL